MILLDGKELSSSIKEELKTTIRKHIIKPCLAVIQIGDDEASNIYIKAKDKACEEVGIYFKHIKFDENVSEREIVNKILELNNDDYVDGILIQLPFPERLDENKFINLISKSKDVDGLTDINSGKVLKNIPNLVPCTPLGIITLLKKYDISFEGKHVVIVGRSNLVGKPLAMLLLNESATVTICHSKTTDLSKYTKEADILISATGVKHLIKEDMVKDNAIVIDVGITRDNGKLYGDVDYEFVSKKCSYITPVPGGVGPMTVAMLLSNVVKNYEIKHSNEI